MKLLHDFFSVPFSRYLSISVNPSSDSFNIQLKNAILLGGLYRAASDKKITWARRKRERSFTACVSIIDSDKLQIQTDCSWSSLFRPYIVCIPQRSLMQTRSTARVDLSLLCSCKPSGIHSCVSAQSWKFKNLTSYRNQISFGWENWSSHRITILFYVNNIFNIVTMM